MSSIANITQEELLQNLNVRHVDFEHEWYFAVPDLNLQYIGAFKNIKGLPLPLQVSGKKERYIVSCIPFSKVAEIANKVGNTSDFQQAIDVLFSFNPKKRS